MNQLLYNIAKLRSYERVSLEYDSRLRILSLIARLRYKRYSALQRYIVIARLRYNLFLSLKTLPVPSFGT